MNPRRHRTALVLFCMAMAGCGHQRDDDEPGTSAVASTVLPDTEDLSDSFFGFNRPVGVVADSAGRIFVADAGESAILVFTAGGRLNGRIGRSGAGPGEFGSVAAIGIWRDTLIVLDKGNARIAFLSLSGAPLRFEPWPPIGGSPRDVRIYPAACGYYVRTTVATHDGLSRAYELRCDSVFDTIFPPRPRNPGTVCRESDGGIGFKSNPLAPRILETPRFEGGLTVARVQGLQLEIVGFDRAGDTLSVTVDSVERFPVALSVRDSLATAQQSFLRSWRGADCTQVGPSPGDDWPPLRQMYYSYEGALIVALYHPLGTEMRVFRDGRRLSSTVVPGEPRDAASFARGRRLYLFRADSLDISRLEVYPY